MMMYNHKLWKTMSLPLPLNQMVVMYFLYNNKTATISEVANHLAISKQQMSPIYSKISGVINSPGAKIGIPGG